MDTSAKQIGPYEILSEIGKGSMGVVYKIRHPQRQKPLAAKVLLHKEEQIDENVKRFYQEIELVSRLNFPNIIKIHDVGTHEGFPYYIMDYIEGQTLDKFLKGKAPLAERTALKIMEKIATALACAHKQDIVHRDLKPANIIIDSENRPYLTDFGIAKCKDGMYKKLTPAGFIVGSPLYMSPEQASGKKKNVGPHSDVYALGTNLYVMLSGNIPFVASSPIKVLDMVINEEPIPIRELNPKISQEAEMLVTKAMCKSIKNRYANAEEFANDIRKVLSGKKVVPAPTQKSAKRNPVVLLFVLTVVLLVAIWYLWRIL